MKEGSDKDSDNGLQSKMTFTEEVSDKIAKYLTTYFGTVSFLIALAIFVLGWIAINSGYFNNIEIFDEYPFILLLMAVQLFEVFLSVMVLINQNRQAKIADVRQQIDLEINVRAENEITKILQLLDEMQKRQGIIKKDNELETMKEKIDIAEIKEVVESKLETEEKMTGN